MHTDNVDSVLSMLSSLSSTACVVDPLWNTNALRPVFMEYECDIVNPFRVLQQTLNPTNTTCEFDLTAAVTLFDTTHQTPLHQNGCSSIVSSSTRSNASDIGIGIGIGIAIMTVIVLIYVYVRSSSKNGFSPVQNHM